MAKTTAIKRTKIFASEVIKGVELDARLNTLNDEGATIIGIIPVSGDMDVYRIVNFTVKTEEVEVDIPEELQEALNQADGAAQA